MIKALVFDFDGLILDTETPDYQSWSEIYEEYEVTLPLEKWASHIGSWGTFNPYQYLEDQIGRELNRVQLRTKRRQRYRGLCELQPLLPGVLDMIRQAKVRTSN